MCRGLAVVAAAAARRGTTVATGTSAGGWNARTGQLLATKRALEHTMSKNLSFLSAMEDRDDMSIEDIVGQVTSAISAPAPGSRARMRTAGLPSDKVPFASCHSLCPGSAQLGECRRLLHLYEIDNKALKSRCSAQALCCLLALKVLKASKQTGYFVFLHACWQVRSR